MSDLNSKNKDYIEITFPSGRTAYKVLFDQLEIPLTLTDENGNKITVRGKRRADMFSIKGIDGITLDDNGIFERGLRAESKLFEDWSRGKAVEFNKSLLEIISNYTVSNAETTLNKLDMNLKNEDGTYRNLGDILDDLSERYKELTTSMADTENKVVEAYESYKAKYKSDKLEELCLPISKYLKENYCPHDSIVITGDNIRLVRDEIGIPVDRYCEEEDEPCSDPRVNIEEAISNIVSFLSKTKIGSELN